MPSSSQSLWGDFPPALEDIAVPETVPETTVAGVLVETLPARFRETA
jgi:hypothetical protein